MPESALFPGNLPSNQRLRGKRPSELEAVEVKKQVPAHQGHPGPASPWPWARGPREATSPSVRRSRKSEQGREKPSRWSLGNVCSNHSDNRNPPACQTCPHRQAQWPVPSTGVRGVIHTLLLNTPLPGCLPGALHLLRPRALKAALSVHTLPAVARGDPSSIHSPLPLPPENCIRGT